MQPEDAENAVYMAALARLRKAIERVASCPSIEALQEVDSAREEATRLNDVIRIRSEARAKKAITPVRNINYVMPKKLKSEALTEAANRLRAAADLLMAIDEQFLSTAIQHFYVQTHNKARRMMDEERAAAAKTEPKDG